MAGDTPPTDMTTIPPVPVDVFRQIVEGQPTDPTISRSVWQTLTPHGLLGEWLALLPADRLAEPRWRGQLRAVQLTAMRLAATSATVSGTLQQAGIPHVVYKGVATSVVLGATWNLRQSADVDVLVPKRELTHSLAALARSGWTVPEGYQVPNRVRAWADCELTLEGPGVGLDMHWRLNPSPLALRLPVDELILSGMDVAVGQSQMRTLSPEHSALMTAVHGSREFWWQAKWLVDLARALCVVDPWVLRHSARNAGAERSLAIGCAALFDLAPSTVPPVLQPRPDVVRLWRAMSRRPMTALRRRALKTRSADSLTAGLDALARSVVDQVVSQ